MKKLIITIAIALFMAMTTFAQEAFTGTDGVPESGLFGFGTDFFNGELGLFSSDYYDYDEEFVAYNNYPQNYVENSGLFGMGNLFTRTDPASGLVLPGSHGQTDDTNAPLGSGALLLVGFGAAYAMKKRKEK